MYNWQHAILQILSYQRAQFSTLVVSSEKSKNAKIDQKFEVAPSIQI